MSLSTALFNNANLGAGGMADTRDPDAYQDDDPRKSISAAPSFEEYLKMRNAGAAPAAAPAAAAVAPPAAAALPQPPLLAAVTSWELLQVSKDRDKFGERMVS